MKFLEFSFMCFAAFVAIFFVYPICSFVVAFKEYRQTGKIR